MKEKSRKELLKIALSKDKEKISNNLIWLKENKTKKYLEEKFKISQLIHDISTPLTNALIKLELLEQIENPPSKEKLSDIIKNINYINLLINNYKKENFDTPDIRYTFRDVVHDALLILKHRIEKGNIDVQVEGYDITLIGHRNTLKQILINLIQNSVESMQKTKKKVLTIKFKEEKDKLQIEIIDTGIGIKEKHLDIIFSESFSTKDSLGIGLSIVKKHVEDTMKGTINVESEYKKGTSFIITLPK